MASVGTTDVLWTAPFGSKRVAFVRLRITTYDATSGYSLTPRQAGLGVIEGVFMTVQGTLNSLEAPMSMAYSTTLQSCLFFKAAGTTVTNGTNLYTAIGDIILMVVGA